MREPWSNSINRVTVPPGEPFGAVICPTEGCGYPMTMNGNCPRCGWRLVVTRDPLPANPEEAL